MEVVIGKLTFYQLRNLLQACFCKYTNFVSFFPRETRNVSMVKLT